MVQTTNRSRRRAERHANHLEERFGSLEIHAEIDIFAEIDPEPGPAAPALKLVVVDEDDWAEEQVRRYEEQIRNLPLYQSLVDWQIDKQLRAQGVAA